MSKTYFGRCAAVGIAGLTAMSSIAIVASAATQASVIYELNYKGVGQVVMNINGYVSGSNKYCVRDGAGKTDIGAGFNVNLDTKFKGLTASYIEVEYDSAKKTVVQKSALKTVNVWDTTASTGDFANISYSLDGTGANWVYQTLTPTSPNAPVAVKLNELFADRGGIETNEVIAFKSEADRTTAKNAIVSALKAEYGTIASSAIKQFNSDISDLASKATKRIADERDATLRGLNQSLPATPTDDEKGTYNAAVQNANAEYNAKYAAISEATSTIKTEFAQTFAANNYVYDNAFEISNCPIKLSNSLGGVGLMADAEYTSTDTNMIGGTAGGKVDLSGAKYWNGAAVRNTADNKSYLFAGEVYGSSAFAASNVFLFLGNTANWKNFQVLNNDVNSGGNTSPNGNTNNDTKKDDTTTTVTTWYPDSAAYRAASEVSYLGKNGSWYTSASAATTYGGGYTGTSKNSNYSAVNSANNGKAIYFDSTSGTYTTTATSYSYVVKEATTTTNDDPYYNYFFGNKNNNTTTSVPAGSPAISGASKYAGWTNISAYITNRAKSGATYTINMNDGTVVPAAVLAAAKAKNVTLVFANDNGSKVTVKPGKVSTTSDLNVAVTYNVKDVKSSLVKKAKKVNKGTVSTAQVRIGTDGSIGGTETVTVKFSTKRAGCTVKAYRLTESGSLKKEASGTVASTGRANLNLTKGGSYLLVVIDD